MDYEMYDWASSSRKEARDDEVVDRVNIRQEPLSAQVFEHVRSCKLCMLSHYTSYDGEDSDHTGLSLSLIFNVKDVSLRLALLVGFHSCAICLSRAQLPRLFVPFPYDPTVLQEMGC